MSTNVKEAERVPLMRGGPTAGAKVKTSVTAYRQLRGQILRLTTQQSRSPFMNCCQVCCPMTLLLVIVIIQSIVNSAIHKGTAPKTQYYPTWGSGKTNFNAPQSIVQPVYSPITSISAPPALRSWRNDTRIDLTSSGTIDECYLSYARSLYFTGASDSQFVGELTRDGRQSGLFAKVQQYSYANIENHPNWGSSGLLAQTSNADQPLYSPAFVMHDFSVAEMNNFMYEIYTYRNGNGRDDDIPEGYSSSPYGNMNRTAYINLPLGGVYFENGASAQKPSWTGQFMPPGKYPYVYYAYGPFYSAVNAFSYAMSTLHGGIGSLFLSNNTRIELRGASRGLPLVMSTFNPFSFCVSCALGNFIYPIVLSMLFPVFVYTLVAEKESRVRELMKMFGMKESMYNLSLYLYFTLMSTGSWLCFTIFAAIFNFAFITETSFLVYFLLFVLWTNAIIAFSMFIAAFFSSARFAFVFTFFIWLAAVNVSPTLNLVLWSESPMPWWIGVMPLMAFFRGIFLINAPLNSGLVGMRSYNLEAGNEFSDVLANLFLSSLVFYLLAYYIDAIFPKQYGVRKHPCFPCIRAGHLLCPRRYTLLDDAVELVASGSGANLDIDSDVMTEAQLVQSGAAGHTADSAAIVVSQIKKVFPGPKIAVGGISLAFQKGEIFGLLGPNGAGKTTLINMLTGMYEPTSGDGWVNGFNIKKQMDLARQSMGVCPQHDILFDTLTVREHLLFYARLKGVAPSEEKEHVTQQIAFVGLEEAATRRSKALSGGMKRRLSVAIAFVGESSVVFLDEPTTGLDPENRRHLWDVIQRGRAKAAVILTTHSMEEADVLSTRLGIVARGHLQCLGTPNHLKTKYGEGFQLQLVAHPGMFDAATAYITRAVPGASLATSFGLTATYKFKATPAMDLAAVFEEIETHKEANGIKEWSMSQTTLEEVFINLVKRDEELSLNAN